MSGRMKRKLGLALTILLFVSVANAAALTTDGPVAYLIEKIEGTYNQDGTNRSALVMTGRVEVYVNDSSDVLQFIRVNVTHGAEMTNITTLLSNTTYKGYAASPTGGRTVP